MTWRALAGCVLVVGVLSATACAPGAEEEQVPVDLPTTTEVAPPDAEARDDDAAWAALDRRLGEVAPRVGFLVAEVTVDGRCDAVHLLDATTARPMAGQSNLIVLGAVADRVAAGDLVWHDVLTVEDRHRSLGSAAGSDSLQFAPSGTWVSVGEAATRMVATDDTTATDLLIDTVGRPVAEVQTARWVADAARNVPFLTTREAVVLRDSQGLGNRYLTEQPESRLSFLEDVVSDVVLREVVDRGSDRPRLIDEIGWFAAPADVCRALAGLHVQARQPELGLVIGGALDQDVGGIELDPDEWPTVWHESGSAPGVLASGWLATDADGDTFVVQVMLSDQLLALPTSTADDVAAIAADAFALVA